MNPSTPAIARPMARSEVQPHPQAAMHRYHSLAGHDMQAVLSQLAGLGGRPIEHLTPTEARQQPTPADAVTGLLRERGLGTAPEPVATVEDRTIPGSGGPIAIRLYSPTGSGPLPVLLYIHGGGWVLGSLDSYDSSARALANATGAIVVSTHYRLAPEHPFPASHEDAFAAYRWVLENSASFQGDPHRVAIAGESAGGNMAVAVALMAREHGVSLPVHQLLIYPVANTDTNTTSFDENEHAMPLNKAMMEWFARHEFVHAGDKKDPRIDLLHADLQGLPPATIITAAIDPLRSGGKALADALEAAGVAVDYKCYDGVTHEFFGMGAVLAESRDATRLAAKNLRHAFR